MLSAIVSVLSTIFCFAHPLLLTAKLVNLLNAKSDSGRQAQHVRFLFNYWFYYIILTQIENSLFIKVLDMSTFNMVQVVSFGLKIWLFYGKGCLILTYYYFNSFLNKAFNQTSRPHLDYFEVKFVDPFVQLLVLNSVVVSRCNRLFLTMSGSNNIINSILQSVNNFFFELNSLSHQNRLKSPFFLNNSLEYFCDIDNQMVYRNYKLTNQFLNFFSLSPLSYYTSSPQGYAPGGNTLMNRKVRHSKGTRTLAPQIPIPPTSRQPQIPPQGYTSTYELPLQLHKLSYHSASFSTSSSIPPLMFPSNVPPQPRPEYNTRFISDKLELLEQDRLNRLDNYENYEPRSLSDSASSPRGSSPRRSPGSRSRAGSGSTTHSGMLSPPAPNAVNSQSIDQILNNSNLKDKSSTSSPGSSISRPPSLQDLPYPIDS